MNFRLQDIVKMLVPGTVFLLANYLLLFNPSKIEQWLMKDFVPLYVIVFLVTLYVLGYFIDWFGSLFERLFYWIFPRPSQLLLNDDQKKPKCRVNLSNKEEIVEYLCLKLKKSHQFPFTRENSLKLFKMANYLKDHNKSTSAKERLNELYFAKILAET